MKNKIGNFENMELIDKIVLNGKVGDCDTNDDNSSTIGIYELTTIPTFDGKNIITKGRQFPLTKEIESRIGWRNNYASIRFVTGDTAIDPSKIEETIIECYYGDANSNYSHRYSDYTGYLWTDEDFKVGGHDIPKILQSFYGKYIHMEIELYKEKK